MRLSLSALAVALVGWSGGSFDGRGEGGADGSPDRVRAGGLDWRHVGGGGAAADRDERPVEELPGSFVDCRDGSVTGGEDEVATGLGEAVQGCDAVVDG